MSDYFFSYCLYLECGTINCASNTVTPSILSLCGTHTHTHSCYLSHYPCVYLSLYTTFITDTPSLSLYTAYIHVLYIYI